MQQHTDAKEAIPSFRDIALTIACFLFLIGTFSYLLGDWPVPTVKLEKGLALLGLTAGCVLLARVKPVVVVGVLGIVAVRGALGIVLQPSLHHKLVALAISVPCGILAYRVGMRMEAEEFRNRYEFREGLSAMEILAALVGGGGAIFIWLGLNYLWPG
jgi:hypothetical protein